MTTIAVIVVAVMFALFALGAIGAIVQVASGQGGPQEFFAVILLVFVSIILGLLLFTGSITLY